MNEIDQQQLKVCCPICGTANFNQPPLPYSQKMWELKQCVGCGMVYLENPPAYEALEEELAWEKTFAAESAERSKRNPTLRKIGRLLKAKLQQITKRNKLLDLAKVYFNPGPILDVGCAGGHTLVPFPDCYIPYGIEISHELSQVAAGIFIPRGGRVILADALTGLKQLPRNEFTGIVMTSFLEHDINAKETLLAIRRVMRPDAKLVVKVPNYASWNRSVRGSRWCGFRFPDHVNYFTPKLLKRMLIEAGFKVVRFGFLDRMPTSDTMWLVAEKSEQSV